MAHFHIWRPGLIVLSICLSGPCARAAEGEANPAAPEGNHWRLVASPYTHHFRFSAEHRPVWALGIERQRPDGWLAGASFFKNSFGQPSGYVYIGRRYEGLLLPAPMYLQWSGGIMYGYKGKYQTKVPLNFGGYSPGLLVSAGWQVDRHFSVQLNLLGDAAVMLQIGHAWR